MNMQTILSKLRTAPWILAVAVAIAIAVCLPIFPDGFGGTGTIVGFVFTWVGTVFKAISGALVAFFFCRYVLKLDLSTIADPIPRALAGLGQALVIAAFVLGVTKGL